MPKKLFTPKCLHPDRDITFREDIENFYYDYIESIFSDSLNKDLLINFYTDKQIYTTQFENPYKVQFLKELIEEGIRFLTEKNVLGYEKFKSLWKIKKIGLLHYTKYKEENTNEYYQTLFKEVQMYLFPTDERNFISKIFSLYTLYSLYYTQPFKVHKVKVNVILESLKSINLLLNYIKQIDKLYEANFVELYLITKKMYSDQAFKITTLIGMKTIILNKYCLPLENTKNDIYNEYKEFFKSKEKLKQLKILNIDNNINTYQEQKASLINDIKDLFSNNNKDQKLYCDKLNEIKGKKNLKIKLEVKTELENVSKVNNIISYPVEEHDDVNYYNISDLNKDQITSLDVNFNQFDSFKLINK